MLLYYGMKSVFISFPLLQCGMFPFAWKMKVGDLGDLKSRIWLIYSLIWEQRFSFSQIDLTSIRPGRLLPSPDCKENHSAKIYDSAESLIILWALTLPWIIELGISRMRRMNPGHSGHSGHSHIVSLQFTADINSYFKSIRPVCADSVWGRKSVCIVNYVSQWKLGSHCVGWWDLNNLKWLSDSPS